MGRPELRSVQLEPWMFEGFLQSDPGSRILREETSDEMETFLRDPSVDRKIQWDLLFQDGCDDVILRLSEEGQTTREEDVHQDTATPDIHQVRVTSTQDHLRCDVHDRPPGDIDHLRWTSPFAESEIDQQGLDAFLVLWIPEEDVLGFDVPMHDPPIMQILQSIQDLPDETPCDFFREDTNLLESLECCPAHLQWHDDEDGTTVLEGLLHGEDVRMGIQECEDRDLPTEEFRIMDCELALRDHLRCVLLLGTDVNGSMHIGEASLTDDLAQFVVFGEGDGPTRSSECSDPEDSVCSRPRIEGEGVIVSREGRIILRIAVIVIVQDLRGTAATAPLFLFDLLRSLGFLLREGDARSDDVEPEIFLVSPGIVLVDLDEQSVQKGH